MKLFISWSGERSRFVAAALRSWLKMVLQAVDPWMAEVDASEGQRWNPDLESELYKSVFGISCVTPHNCSTPWLLFEAGALAAQVKVNEFLCAYLIDLRESDLEYPLAQFRALGWNREGTLDLVRAINSALKELEPKSALDDSVLDSLFALLWPDLEKKLTQAPPEVPRSLQRDEIVEGAAQMLSEILEETRGLSRRVGRIEQGMQDNAVVKSVQAFSAAVAASVADEPAVRPDAGPRPGLPREKSVPKKSTKPVHPEVVRHRELSCSGCGETENLRVVTRTREFSPKIDHHDLYCENCKTVLRQFHTFKADEDQVRSPCPKDCSFRLSKK
jgi:hypothetical protein